MSGRSCFACFTLLGLAAAAPGLAAPQIGTPQQVADLCPGSCSSQPRWLTRSGGSLYFATHDFGEPDATGLWRLAPRLDGPERVDAGRFTQIAVAGDRLFVVRDEAFVEVLEPEGGPARLVETEGLTDPMTAVGDRMFVPGLAPVEPQGLWVTDGSPEGTELLGAWPDGCAAFPGDRRAPPESLTAAGGTLFFVLYDPQGGCDTELWKSDGTMDGTVRVETGTPGPAGRLAALGDGVVYTTTDGGLWITDRAPGSARRLAAPFPKPPAISLSIGDLVFFQSEDETGLWSLWRTDGTSEGTFELGPLGAPSALAPGPAGLLVFTRTDEAHGTELWRTDGTVAGTRLLRDIRPGPAGSIPHWLTPTGGLVAFRADDGEHGDEPWITDGTEAVTVPLGDLNPGPAGSLSTILVQGFARYGGFLYFAADDGATGQELWRVRLDLSDGTPPPSPPPDDATEIFAPELGPFRLWVRITAAGEVQASRREECIPETVCVSGAVPGRSELFVRIVGPKPNGFLWPTLVRFSTSTLEVWIERLGTGELRHYRLEGAGPGSSELDGLFDRHGFLP